MMIDPIENDTVRASCSLILLILACFFVLREGPFSSSYRRVACGFVPGMLRSHPSISVLSQREIVGRSVDPLRPAGVTGVSVVPSSPRIGVVFLSPSFVAGADVWPLAPVLHSSAVRSSVRMCAEATLPASLSRRSILGFSPGGASHHLAKPAASVSVSTRGCDGASASQAVMASQEGFPRVRVLSESPLRSSLYSAKLLALPSAPLAFDAST